ncbi:MAG: prepilin-type N-terminal cleavage/methylation domain-containing protein [Candidatus Omnitrophica bacterium]|nr:prepilin-type N-terminal cleavage/methylation domain-containing protein [Candidatus Omnitrophota bacterium]
MPTLLIASAYKPEGRSFKKAFTLIEMVMTILIIGILAAIAIPRFESFYSIKLDGATKKVVSDIRYIQQLALSRHTNCRIDFNPAANTYSAQEEVPQDSGNWVSAIDPFTHAALSVDFNNHTQYQGIGIDSAGFGGSSVLQFNWLGAPQSGGSLVLVYQGRSRTISVESNTGRVNAQ